MAGPEGSHRKDAAAQAGNSSSDIESTQRVAQRLTADGESAMAELYTRVAPAIHAYASLRLGNRWIGPDDVVAEVWCRIAGRLAEYDAARSFRGWVFGFAQRVVQEAQRRLARLPATGFAEPDSAASGTLARIPASITSVSSRVARDDEMKTFVAWAQRELTDYEREVLLLRGIQGRALSAVADVLGRSERAVTVCWARLLEKVSARRMPQDVLLATQG